LKTDLRNPGQKKKNLMMMKLRKKKLDPAAPVFEEEKWEVGNLC